MHSYIISGGTEEARMGLLSGLVAKLRDEKPQSDPLSILDPDLHILTPDPSITIDAVRKLKKALMLKPLAAKVNLAVIASADALSLQAQHALLKTLEEPTPRTHIILELSNPHALLPTIRSRCQMIMAAGNQRRTDLSLSEELLVSLCKGPPASRVAVMERFAKREEALESMESLLTLLHGKMQTEPGWAQAVKLTEQTISDLHANVNLGLSLGRFALHFPPFKKAGGTARIARQQKGDLLE